MLKSVFCIMVVLATSSFVYAQNGGDRTGNGVQVDPIIETLMNTNTCGEDYERINTCSFFKFEMSRGERDHLFSENPFVQSFFNECCWE